MSKTKELPKDTDIGNVGVGVPCGPGPDFSCGYAYVMQDSSPDFIVGKILTIIDAMGLKENQEKATKDLVKQIVRDEFWKGIYITPKRNNEIHKELENRREESYKKQVPLGAV